MVALSSLVAATKIFNKSLTSHVQAPAPGGTAAAAQTAPAGQPAAAQASSGSNTGAIAGGVVGGVVVVALLALAAAYFARRRQRRAHREEPVSPYKDVNGSKAGVLALRGKCGACMLGSFKTCHYVSVLSYGNSPCAKATKESSQGRPCPTMQGLQFQGRGSCFGGEYGPSHPQCSKGLHPQAGVCCEVAAARCLLTEMGPFLVGERKQ